MANLDMTINQWPLVAIVFAVIVGLLLIIIAYMTFICIKRHRRLKNESPIIACEPHPYAWRTRVEA